jgi:hypothetical protein
MQGIHYVPHGDRQTQRRIRDPRIARVKATAESLGLRWGTVEMNYVTVYFGEGAYRETLKNLSILLAQWKQRSDEGDRSWYEWNEAVFTNKTDEYMNKHYPNRCESGEKLRKLLATCSECEILALAAHPE